MQPISTRAELVAALEGNDPNNPLSSAIRAVLHDYVAELTKQAERLGGRPNPLVLPAPSNEIEAFALEIFARHIAQHGMRVTITSDS